MEGCPRLILHLLRDLPSEANSLTSNTGDTRTSNDSSSSGSSGSSGSIKTTQSPLTSSRFARVRGHTEGEHRGSSTCPSVPKANVEAVVFRSDSRSGFSGSKESASAVSSRSSPVGPQFCDMDTGAQPTAEKEAEAEAEPGTFCSVNAQVPYFGLSSKPAQRTTQRQLPIRVHRPNPAKQPIQTQPRPHPDDQEDQDQMLERSWEYQREWEHRQRTELQSPQMQGPPKLMPTPPAPSLPPTPRLGAVELDEQLDELDDAPVGMFEDLGVLEKRIEWSWKMGGQGQGKKQQQEQVEDQGGERDGR